jgi:hypothetical protein
MDGLDLPQISDPPLDMQSLASASSVIEHLRTEDQSEFDAGARRQVMSRRKGHRVENAAGKLRAGN